MSSNPNQTTEPRRFERKTPESYKFWSIEVSGNRVTTKFGRIGSKGRSMEKQFGDADEATKYVLRKIDEKNREGYEEVKKTKVERKTNEQLWEELKSHEPFIRSIVDSPDSLEPLHVYADWLMERGDVRGEFIQCQIKLQDYSTPLRELEGLEKEAAEIQAANWHDWLGPLSPFFKSSNNQLQFINGHLGSIHSTYFDVELAETLKKSPHCRLLRRLKIDSISFPTEDVSINGSRYYAGEIIDASILHDADFSNLRFFSFTSMNFHWYRGDRRKRFSQEPTSGAALFRLIQAMPNLEHLALNTRIRPKDYTQLFESKLPRLRHFELDEKSAGIVIQLLSQSDWVEQLETLTFHCGLSEKSCELIAERFDPDILETVYVLENRVSERGINTLEKNGTNVMIE